MNKEKDDVKTLLIIQYISYLRGKKRYALLRDYADSSNLKFRWMWSNFYKDADNNAKMTMKYLIEEYGFVFFSLIRMDLYFLV